MPGTELAFEQDLAWERPFSFFRRRPLTGRLVRFRRVDPHNPYAHHDAVEFPDGRTVLLTILRPGQRATVLQLPAERPDGVGSEPITTRSPHESDLPGELAGQSHV